MSARNARSGLPDPATFFEALRPAREACTGQLRNLRPYGADYHMLSVVIAALDAAAAYFTKQRDFYTVSQQPDMIGRKLPDART
jgi:hypothetical protein